MLLMIAYFAGGCFWCMEQAFEEVPGVTEVVSGYMGGHHPNPTYKEVSAGTTGHTEAIKVSYDSSKVSYEKLLEVFWHNIDPTAENKQFCDVGSQYRSGIYYLTDTEKKLAEKSKKVVAGKFDKVHTEIKPASLFFKAEEKHQDYYKKHPLKYKFYKNRCGRPQTLNSLWGTNPVFHWEPSANKEPSAHKEPSANKEPSESQQPSVQNK